MKIVKLILVLIPALLTIMSGIMKISGSEQVVKPLTEAGLGSFVAALGIAEVVFAALFLIPKTRTLGFLLLICYFSGALATDLSHHRPVIAPFLFLVFLFVAEFFNRPEIFTRSSDLKRIA